MDKQTSRNQSPARIAKRIHLTELAESHKTPCVICGVEDRSVIHYDHMNRALKWDSISNLISNHCSDDALLDEIDACRCLCANCHKVKTDLERRMDEQPDWADRTDVQRWPTIEAKLRKAAIARLRQSIKHFKAS